MKQNKYIVPLAVLLTLGTGPATDATRDAYERFFHDSQKAAQRVAEVPRSGLENVLGGVTYAQDASSKTDFAVDYDALAIKAEKLDPYNNPHKVIPLLAPYRNDPNNRSTGFFNTLGLAIYSSGDLEDAISLYEKSIQLDPTNYSAHYNKAVAHYKRALQHLSEGDIEKARSELEKAYEHISISANKRPDHTGSQKWEEHIKRLLGQMKKT